MKVYQHTKAIGNARSTVRSAMIPIFRKIDAGQDEIGQAETAYGPERVTPEPILYIDPTDGTGILAVGRLERMSADEMGTDSRLTSKEAYRLYWLPFSIDAGSDYVSNPQEIGADINPVTPQGVKYLVEGMRVWVILDAPSLPDASGNWSEVYGLKATEFVVIEVFRNGIADVVEYEAVIVRAEGAKALEIQQL